MTVNELCEKYSFSPVSLPDGDREVKGGYTGDLLSWVMSKAQCDNIWVTIMSNINIVAVASLTDVACILLTEGVTLDDNVIQTANNKGVNILMTEMSAFDAIRAVVADI